MSLDTTQVAAVEAADGLELRIAPGAEPLASCAFEWPDGWTPRCPVWRPPPLFAPSPLLSLTGPEGTLDVLVARFGCEVDGLAFLRWWQPGDWRRLAWRGLPVGAGILGETDWRVVHSGPALHLLAAAGEARAHLDRAAVTLRTLSGRPPPAEPVAPLGVGPLTTLRLASWQAAPRKGLPHGFHGADLWCEDPRGGVTARLRLLVADRRIHVGLDPRALIEQADALRRADPDLELGPPEPDLGADGPAERWSGRLGATPVEARRAVRLAGPALILADGLWPSPAHAPVAWLNGRRHLDVLLANARAAQPS